MRKLLPFFTLLAVAVIAKGQDYSYKVSRDIHWSEIAEVAMNDTAWVDVSVTQAPLAPMPGMSSETKAIKEKLDAARKRKYTQLGKNDEYNKTGGDLKPEVPTTFDGLPISQAGIPNDNNMAISNAGTVVSVINSSVSMFNSKGDQLAFRTLASITAGTIPNLNRTYDPKVIYDPDADRFILVYLQGSTSADTRIIVGFSQSPDPTSTWKFYAVNGNPFGDTTWSDYPIIGTSKEDLFITVNILKDGESWQEGFTQSVIWQIEKESGYNGNDSLNGDLFHDLYFGDKPLWSICVVQGGLNFKQKESHFLTVRPSTASNDTLFMHTISNTWKSRKAEYSVDVYKTNKKYGVPPSAFQPQVGYKLQTNDTRVLSAIEQNGEIQYVQSTLIPSTGMSGIFHGIVTVKNPGFLVQANYIGSDTFEYAYPSIAMVPSNGTGYSTVITFSHVSEVDFPGTSCVVHNKVDNHKSIYSPVTFIKEGEGLINTFVANDQERWGDYTGIQPKYDEAGVVWMSGSYGNENDRNSVWIGKVKVNTNLSISRSESQIKVFPNPVRESFNMDLDLEKGGDIDIRLVDVTGKVITTVYSSYLIGGTYQLQMSVNNIRLQALRPGIYYLQVVRDGEETLHSAKLFVQ